MTSVVGLIQSTTQDLSNQSYLPPLIWSAVSGISTIHSYWRWYRAAEVYANPDNLIHLMSGHALNWAFGNNILVRIAAQTVMICKRLLLCAEAHARLSKNCLRFQKAIFKRLKRPLFHKPLMAHPAISPSTALWWRYTVEPLLYRIQKIGFLFIQIIGGMFELSMRMMDAMEAFALSPTASNEGVNEIFVNTYGCLDALVENKDQLLASMHAQRPLIEKILKATPLSFEQLERSVNHCMGTASFLHQAARHTHLVGKTLLVAGRDMICATGRLLRP